MTEERERIVRDIKESHRLELQELERKYCEQPAGAAREITPEVARALREDLSCLEAERNHLRNMQVCSNYCLTKITKCSAGPDERADKGPCDPLQPERAPSEVHVRLLCL